MFLKRPLRQLLRSPLSNSQHALASLSRRRRAQRGLSRPLKLLDVCPGAWATTLCCRLSVSAIAWTASQEEPRAPLLKRSTRAPSPYRRTPSVAWLMEQSQCLAKSFLQWLASSLSQSKVRSEVASKAVLKASEKACLASSANLSRARLIW